MTPDRWQQINRLYFVALEQETKERARVLVSVRPLQGRSLWQPIPRVAWRDTPPQAIHIGPLRGPWRLDNFREVQRQDAAGSSQSPVRAKETSPGPVRGGSPGLGSNAPTGLSKEEAASCSFTNVQTPVVPCGDLSESVTQP